MSRLVAVTVWSLCLSIGLAGLAAAQEPPPLEPPPLEPPRTGAAQEPQTETRPKPTVPAGRTRSGRPPPGPRPGRCWRSRASPRPPLGLQRPIAHRSRRRLNGPLPVRAIARCLAAPVGIHNRPVAFPLERSPDGRAALSFVARRHAGASEISAPRRPSNAVGLPPPDPRPVPCPVLDPPDDRADRRPPIERPGSVGRPQLPDRWTLDA